MTNAVRHSKADNIFVKLVHGDRTLSVSVSDDGVGFEPSVEPQNGIGHFGLRGMRTRASKIECDLKITSKPNHGTSIVITVPTTDNNGHPSNGVSKQE
jgi:signal transduction histidine kinase